MLGSTRTAPPLDQPRINEHFLKWHAGNYRLNPMKQTPTSPKQPITLLPVLKSCQATKVDAQDAAHVELLAACLTRLHHMTWCGRRRSFSRVLHGTAVPAVHWTQCRLQVHWRDFVNVRPSAGRRQACLITCHCDVARVREQSVRRRLLSTCNHQFYHCFA